MSDFPEVLNYSNLFFAGSQQQIDNLLDDPRFVSVLQELVEKRLPFVVFPMMKRFMEESILGTLGPMLDNSVRKVVKEQLDRALEMLNAKANWMPRDEPGTSEPRHLTLKFQDRVHVPVYTRNEIKGENGNSIRVALVDAGGNLINSGSEASSKVKIMVRLDGVDDSESSSACGESGSCTKLTEKKLGKPLLSKKCLKLKEGIAVLDNVKFRNKSQWTKRFQIRLVARFIGNIKGTIVKDAETEAFRVTDCRSLRYKKRHPPLPDDGLWQLTGISKKGKLLKHLQKENINSVREFLIAYNLNPQSFQEVIVRLGINAEKFKATVKHAKECEIPRGLHIYDPSSGENAAEVFDDVECVRGLVHNDVGFVPAVEINDDDEVVSAPPLSGFFVTRCCDNEASTSDFPAQTPNDANTSISPRLASPSGFIMGPNKTIDGYDFEDLPPLNSPCRYDSNGFYSIDLGSLSPGMNYCDNFLLFNHDAVLQSANPCVESHNNQNSSAAVCKGSSTHVHSSGKAKRRWEMVVMFVRKSSVSVRKRIVAPEDTHVQKKQRHC